MTIKISRERGTAFSVPFRTLETEAGPTISDLYESLKEEYDLGPRYLAMINGSQKDPSYITQDGDIIIFRPAPKKEGKK